jgi:Holliday junction DNA helicase RuvA
MYAYLKGRVMEVLEDRIILEVNDTGYNIFPSEALFSSIRSIGDELKVYTYLQVREDAMSLFGFYNSSELELFKQLITVNGVGPKAGLTILKILPLEELKLAIISGDSKTLSKAAGVGAKTAQKIILDLKDKIKVNSYPLFKDNLTEELPQNNAVNEAILALVSLGYTQTEAAKAVRAIEDVSEKSVEVIIKESLKRMI